MKQFCLEFTDKNAWKKVEGKAEQFNSEIFIGTEGNITQLSRGRKKKTKMEVVSWTT